MEQRNLELEKLIEAISRTGKKLDADIQQALLLAVDHFADHGNPVYINRIYAEFPKGSKRDAAVLWLGKFGGVMVNKDRDPMANNAFIKDQTKTPDTKAGARVMWHSMVKDKEPEVLFDAVAGLQRLIERAMKSEAVNISPEQLETLSSVFNDIKAHPYDPADALLAAVGEAEL